MSGSVTVNLGDTHGQGKSRMQRTHSWKEQRLECHRDVLELEAGFARQIRIDDDLAYELVCEDCQKREGEKLA